MHGQSYVRCGLIAALVLPSVCGAPAVGADPYPSRRITLVVPYTAGSGFDTVARTVGQKFAERSGQPVVVDNKPGASGMLGAEFVANAAPDGYTLLLTGTPLTVSATLSKTMRINPVADFRLRSRPP
jgi:tripartite-type tricarboxylate transporter receptor subunit TctC